MQVKIANRRLGVIGKLPFSLISSTYRVFALITSFTTSLFALVLMVIKRFIQKKCPPEVEEHLHNSYIFTFPSISSIK
jgi:hypothetical protein